MRLGIIQTRRRPLKLSRTMLPSVRLKLSFLSLFRKIINTVIDKNKIDVKSD